MDVMKAIQDRRSIRAYREGDIPEATLSELIEAARLAPSANNRQDHFFVVVRDRGIRDRLAEAARQPFIAEASLILAGVSTNPERLMPCQVPPYAMDVTIAMTDVTLAAAASGLGTCWIGAFDQEMVKDILDLPPESKVVALMPVGWPVEVPQARPRKSREELFRFMP